MQEFFFLSGSTALDFVNTRPAPDGRPVELLTDFAALLRWFVAAALLDQRSSRALQHRWGNGRQARAALRQLLRFREELRNSIELLEGGHSVPPQTLVRLNRLLRQHPMYTRLVHARGSVRKAQHFAPRTPVDLFAPLAEAAVDLFTRIQANRLRQCEGCILHFHDTTKNRTRRWCSMKLCGNRAKVAAYAARHRGASGGK